MQLRNLENAGNSGVISVNHWGWVLVRELLGVSVSACVTYCSCSSNMFYRYDLRGKISHSS